MRPLRRFLVRLRNTITPRRHEARMQEEIEEHIALQTEENERAGLPPAEARRQAVVKFGAVEAIKEAHRAEQALVFFQTFFRDLRYGVRSLARSPGFTAVALLTLALGIGANTVIFSAINGILIEHLPYANASRLLTIRREQVAWGLTLAEVRAIREQCPAFDRLAVSDGRNLTMTIGDGSPIRRWSSYVGGEFFPLLGLEPLLGRYIVPADTEPGGSPVAVLSYAFWRDNFGKDPGVVGREIVVDKTRYTIAGVMPDRFEMGVDWMSGSDEGLWLPLVDPRPEQRYGDVIGRVKEGVDLSVAQAQIEAISPQLQTLRRFPPTTDHLAVHAETPQLFIEPDIRTGLLILQGAVALVLLLASVNISALLVARSWSRQRDLAIRKALGASRLRIVRQLLAESLVLALAGGALGVLLAAWGIRVVRAIAPPGTPRVDRMQLDADVLWFTFGVSVLAAILFGLLPAMQASASRAGDVLSGGLSAMFSSSAGRRRHFLRNGLLIVEVGLAVVLVAGGALLVRSFYNLMNVDTGVQADHALTMHVEIPCTPQCRPEIEGVLEAINSLPGVERAALSGSGPFGGFSSPSPIVLEDSGSERPYGGEQKIVTPGFFEAAGIRLLRGRDFRATDQDVAIVSEEFADRYVAGNPLGRRFARKDENGPPVWLEIIGVVNGTRNRALREFVSDPPYYTPHPLGSSQGQIIVRTAGDPMAVAPAVERVIRAADKTAIITDVQTLEQMLSESAALPRFQTTLFGAFGLLALFLAVIGIYGVTSYSAQQRTHEIGVRMALGAPAAAVTRRMVAEGGTLALAGIAIGLGVAMVLLRSLQQMLYGIQPIDPGTFAGVAALLFAAALAACYLPARSATRADPVATLRHE